MVIAHIGLGSNLNNPLEQLQQAIFAISHLADSEISVVSSIYQTSSVGPISQDDYFNAALALKTNLSPLQLLNELNAIENQQGRVRIERWGPRIIDLDILFYGEKVMHTAELTVPHPEIEKRLFVLMPLLEIGGSALLPKHSIEILIQNLLREGGQRISRLPNGTLS